MDIRKLRYFVGVAEAGGFRRAAKNLHVAQPALSNQIRELEAEFGVKFLERGRLGVSLTEEGQRLLVESRDIIERVDRLAASIERPKGPVSGVVKLGAPYSVAAYLFGPLVRGIRDRYPEIHLKCNNETPRLMELLATSEIDLAIISRIEPDDIQGSWRVDRLVNEQSYLVGPAAGMTTAPVDFNFVMGLPLVLSPVPHPRRVHMQRLALEAGRTLNVTAETSAVSAQASFVQQGLGYAVMPHSAALLIKSSAPLEIAPIEGLQSCRLLVRRGDRKQSQASAVVVDLILEHFRRGWPRHDASAEMPIALSETA